jgi:hypothetical protein
VRLFNDLRGIPRWEAIVMGLSVAALAGWAIGKHAGGPDTGFIAVELAPADATVLIDEGVGVKVVGRSPLMIERSPGPHTVSVTRDGYQREDHVVQVVAGRATALKVSLQASPDTGFDLTSEPPGLRVWLDGAPVLGALMNGSFDGQVRTNFRAVRITPGRHAVEVSGIGFETWREDVEIEPGSIRKIHAVMTPIPRR